jgi:co-chaperonin GroES (HSP10)
MSILERALPIDSAPKLSPLNDYVYVRQDRIPDKVGSFYLPDSTRKHKATRYGTVLAVGPGRLVCYHADEEPENWGKVANAHQITGQPLKLLVTSHFTAEVTEGGWWITKRLPLSVKPSDRVAFMDFAGECVFADTDPSLLLMREEEILARIE